MKPTHNLTYKLIGIVLFVGLFLQSCGPFSDVPRVQLEENKEKEDKKRSTDLMAIQSLDNQELAAEGGYLITFHIKDGELQADVRVDRNQKVPNYKNLPVVIEEGTNLVRLSRLASKVQQSYIKFQPNKASQLNRICIFNGGIAGGMMEGDVEQKKEPENEVVRTFSAEEFAAWQRLNFNRYLPYIPGEAIKYQLLHSNMIGSGGYGIVYKGKYQEKEVAIKVLNKQDSYKKSVATFKKEATIMANTPHNNIVLVKGVCPEINAIVMEYMPGGTLEDLILGCGKDVRLQKRYQIALDIAEGLCYLHDRGIVHCDLKSANILLDDNFRAKVADFGISGLKSAHTTFGAWEGSTYPWVAPEIFYTQKNSREGDVYSYGMILWQLWACKPPFENVTWSEIMDHIKTGNREVISEDTPSHIRDIINLCWSPEPPLKKETDIQQRPPMKDVRRLLEAGLEEGDQEGFTSNKEKELMNEIERLKQQLEQEKQKVREKGKEKEKEKEKGSESFLDMKSIPRTNTAFASTPTLLRFWDQAVYPMYTSTSNKTSKNMKRRKKKINLFKSNTSIPGTDKKVGNKEIGLKHQLELEHIIRGWPEGKKILTELKVSNDTLGLRYCRLAAEEIDILVIHPRFYQIHMLDLTGNKIGASGAIKLAKALPHTKIHTLSLSNNQIGALGAIKLVKALAHTKIHTLDLNRNEIGDSGVMKLSKALANTQLHILDLSSNKINDSAAIELSKSLPTMQLHTLNLSNNKIGDLGAIELSNSLPTTQLHTLNLRSNEIGASGGIKLSEALPKSNIHTLDLSLNWIGTAGVMKLSEILPHTKIHTLDLSWSRISDLEVFNLAEILPITQIHTLDLRGNQIGIEVVQHFSAALPNTKIRILYLSGNNITLEMRWFLSRTRPQITFL